ncbi:hypothetical protein HYH03_016733 [Edaphochlamys debaryana]|uniref:Uncharacterized protein n=1 Tax=Edaphochlamys debaryana TaxID=47281 RepID=A0A836BR97_9CHLO|nr:hypothetical protein HYH03_016733 [Edaphochlamys debaryana]|eukprot:KAG2484423.1 hypothetical protein HYH03_016733 [Edaphochlamys debaryana]
MDSASALELQACVFLVSKDGSLRPLHITIPHDGADSPEHDPIFDVGGGAIALFGRSRADAGLLTIGSCYSSELERREPTLSMPEVQLKACFLPNSSVGGKLGQPYDYWDSHNPNTMQHPSGAFAAGLAAVLGAAADTFLTAPFLAGDNSFCKQKAKAMRMIGAAPEAPLRLDTPPAPRPARPATVPLALQIAQAAEGETLSDDEEPVARSLEEEMAAAAAVAEQQRVAAAAAKQQRAAAEAEQQRVAAEAELRRAAAEAEQQRVAAEAELRRAAAEAEQQRAAAEAEQQRAAAAAEQQRVEAEAEAERRRQREAVRGAAEQQEAERGSAGAGGSQPAAHPPGRQSGTDKAGDGMGNSGQAALRAPLNLRAPATNKRGLPEPGGKDASGDTNMGAHAE